MSTDSEIVLYQHQFPGFGKILWLCKIYNWGKLGEECIGTLCIVFATSCESFKIKQKKETCILKERKSNIFKCLRNN